MTPETNENFEKRMEMSRYYRKKSQKALRNMIIGFGLSFMVGCYSSVKVDSLKKENPLEYKCNRENKESHVCQYNFPPKNEIDFYKTGLLLGFAGGFLSFIIGAGACMNYTRKGMNHFLKQRD